jgi:glucosamine--fructose-6-phosphate aminotransferase (isomerizing)
MSDIFFDTSAGEEKAMAATKSFSSQLIILFLMSLYFADIFDVGIKDRKEVFKELKLLSKKINKVLNLEKDVKKIAKQLAKKENLIITGRKYNFPICLEGAHKIKETAYLHAEGIASEELRHGGEAMLDKNFPVFCLVPTDSVYKENVVLLKELKAIKISIYLFANKNTKQFRDLSKALIILPRIIEPLMPIVSVILLQLLAYHLALAKNIDINKPRNIQKFVG